MNGVFPNPMPTHIYRNSKDTVRPHYNENYNKKLIEKKQKMEEKKNG